MEMLQAVRDGRLPAPPIATTMGFDLDEVQDGRAVFSLEPAEHHYNPIGSVHGGVFATLLDSATGCAVHSTLPAGVGYTSVDLNVKFLRGMSASTGRVTCEGRVVHRGRRLVLAEAARRAGIRITLLDTLYVSSGFGVAPEGAQLRYVDGSVEEWATRVDALDGGPHAPGAELGHALDDLATLGHLGQVAERRRDQRLGALGVVVVRDAAELAKPLAQRRERDLTERRRALDVQDARVRR